MEAIVAAVTAAGGGLRVIWEGQGAPAPSPPYASLSTVFSAALAAAARIVDENPTPSEGQELLEVHAETVASTVRVQVFAPGVGEPGRRAETLRLRLQQTAQLDVLAAHGLSLGDVGDIGTAGAAVAAQFETRAFFDVVLSRIRSVEEPLAKIAGVGISYDIGGVSGSSATDE